MGNAANQGGEISHPEIGPPRPPTAGLPRRAGPPESEVPRGVRRGQVVAMAGIRDHYLVGLCLLFTVVLIVDLRILGMRKRVLCGVVSVAAAGNAGVRHQSHHRDPVLHRNSRTVHPQ